ncbi:MAG: NAD(P)/FAD-dependent oxidoreductase, partial [Gammaproteobacteria bacterium]|nr:NAD(P)/FAD-dependent oxidoreductase [Gammaproteobacteria bacterium]
LYSFSFELNPDWSHRFSPAEEIHAYQQHVMDKYKLTKRTHNGFEVDNASFTDGGWSLVSTRGERVRACYLISAIGALHIPNKPAFAGLDRFEGKLMHSAEWDKTYDFSNKKIIVVGSAASAIQIIPQLAKTASHVSVIQRTASYFIPRKDRAISKFEKALFRSLPFVQRLYRWRQYCFNDFLFHSNFMNKPSLAKKYVHHMLHQHLRRQMSDPDLIDKLTPDYEIGCKRLLLSDDIFPAMQRQNVALVTEGIDHFTERGLVTDSGTEIDADLVVLATGFQSTRLFGNMAINGPNGLTMEQAWADEIRAHRSVAVSGFPNFFMMYGPNSNLGHSSIIIMIEAQARYIARLLRHAIKSGKPTITVRPEAEATFNEEIQKALQNTVWNTGCNSWYKDKNGHIFSLWPHSTTRFIREMRRAPLNEYSFK